MYRTVTLTFTSSTRPTGRGSGGAHPHPQCTGMGLPEGPARPPLVLPAAASLLLLLWLSLLPCISSLSPPLPRVFLSFEGKILKLTQSTPEAHFHSSLEDGHDYRYGQCLMCSSTVHQSNMSSSHHHHHHHMSHENSLVGH